MIVGALWLIVGEGPAEAATFTVNSTADAVDVNPGNSLCADATGACTLRAAVMEANALDGATVQINAVTIRNGNAAGGGTNNDGGGIFNFAGTPTLTGAILSGNTAVRGGGGISTDDRRQQCRRRELRRQPRHRSPVQLQPEQRRHLCLHELRRSPQHESGAGAVGQQRRPDGDARVASWKSTLFSGPLPSGTDREPMTCIWPVISSSTAI